ncbi:hypothetical protein AOLI_G00291480 [Acnodon oligacanthus]
MGEKAELDCPESTVGSTDGESKAKSASEDRLLSPKDRSNCRDTASACSTRESRSEKSSSPPRAKRVCGSPAPPQPCSPRSLPPVPLAPSAPDLHLVQVFQDLADSVRGLESRLVAVECLRKRSAFGFGSALHLCCGLHGFCSLCGSGCLATSCLCCFVPAFLQSLHCCASTGLGRALHSHCYRGSFFSSAVRYLVLSLLGRLNFAMRIIPQGRSLISRLLLLAHPVVDLRDVVALGDGCRSDLRFWSRLLEQWNGVSFFYSDVVESSDSLALFTDATPSDGFGGYFQGFAEKWPAEFSKFALGSASSALHEMYPIVIASVLWGEAWSQKRIKFF